MQAPGGLSVRHSVWKAVVREVAYGKVPMAVRPGQMFLPKGLPKGVWGNCRRSYCSINTDKIYCILENKDGGLYSSNDGGEKLDIAKQ
ncbi:MAG: hypothetical protein IPP73_10175 [Chitinophagaceae bacterium]|nr:hypothetical protein [Chitinophagaceae bacterium]